MPKTKLCCRANKNSLEVKEITIIFLVARVVKAHYGEAFKLKGKIRRKLRIEENSECIKNHVQLTGFMH